MVVYTKKLRVSSAGENDVVDMTGVVSECVRKSTIGNGIAVVFVPGSTAIVTTLEFEPGLVEDFPAALDRLIPKSVRYSHQQAWNDNNGQSHVKASLIGPSLGVPIVEGSLTLGTWQQIVFVELDTRPRERELIVQIVGE